MEATTNLRFAVICFAAFLCRPVSIASAEEEQAPSGPGEPAPNFHCDNRTHDFGTLWAGSKVEHSFVIENRGEKDLQILNVRPTCGCTITDDYDKTIAPGEQGKLKAVLTVSSRSRGKLRKAIRVQTNDPSSANVSLILAGEVKRLIEVEPPMANFGKITGDQTQSLAVKLINHSELPWTLELGELSPDSAFSATLSEVQPNREARLMIETKPPYRRGMNAEEIKIKTGIETLPSLRVSCRLINPPPVEVMPRRFTLPSVELPHNWRRHIRVMYNGEGELKLTSVESSDPQVKVSFDEQKPGKMFRVLVSIPKGYQSDGKKPIDIVIHTDNKEAPKITVPITTIGRPKAARRVQTVVSAESLIGKPAPAKRLRTVEGRPIEIGPAEGKVQLINFWASWCPASRKQLPLIRDLVTQYRPKGVTLTCVAVDELRPGGEVMAKARELNIAPPFALDATRDATPEYGVNQIPILFLVDEQGVVQAVHRGVGRNEEQQEYTLKTIADQLDVLLEGGDRSDFKPTPLSIGEASLVEAATPHGASKTVPELMVESSRQDLGLVKPGEEAQYKLYYRNLGREPLEIEQITGSEGLTVEEGYSRTLRQNVMGSVTVSFTAPKNVRPFEYTLTIDSNDSSKPRHKIHLVGEVREYIEVEPVSGIDFGGNPLTHTIGRMATLTYNGPDQVTYKAPVSSSPRFKATVSETRSDHHKLLMVEALPPFELGETTGLIRIETDCPQQRLLEIPVRLYRPSRIEVKPSTLEVSAANQRQRWTVSIRNHGKDPVHVLGIESSHDAIQTQFFPKADGRSYQLDVTVPPAPAFQCSSDGETITLKTDDAEFETLTVRLEPSDSAQARK